MDASFSDFNSKNQLFLNFDESNAKVSAANYRSYEVKGSCAHIDETVTIRLGSFPEQTTVCQADGTFAVTFDLDGIQEGTIDLSANQAETQPKKISSDLKNIVVDITPPTVTVETPDNADNYSHSSLRARYPLTGTCSDAFNLVKVSSSLLQDYFAVCSVNLRWELVLDLSNETAPSIDYYIQHFDGAGNISLSTNVAIAFPQWHKISPDITATGVASIRLITQYGETGRLLLAAPLRNDDLVDLGILNYNNTGLTRLNPIQGQWGVDTARPIIAVPKYGRALYTHFAMNRAQLRELHSVKVDGTDDKVLMGPTSINPVGGVSSYILTPNQETIIAMGDNEAIDNEFHLYAIQVSTGTIKKLSGDFVSGGDVRDYLLTPDGSKVIFRADKDTDEGIDLYVVNIDGTGLRRLGTAMATSKSVLSGYRISSDSKWVVYRETQSFLSGSNAGSSVVNIETGEQISFATSSTGFIEAGLFSPNSKYIAYRVDRTTAGCYALEVYDLQLRTETEVSPPCPNASTDLYTFTWSPNSSQIAFGMATTASIADLYVNSPTGGNLVKLTGATALRNGLYQGFRDESILFNSQSDQIVFQADLSGVVNATTAAMKFDLYSVKVDGSEGPIKLTSNANAGVVKDYPLIELSPSGDRVAFVADLEVDAKYEMYLAALDGSSIRKLNPVIANAQGDVLTAAQTFFFDWPRNLVAMTLDRTIDLVYELHFADLSATASPSRHLPLPNILSGDVATVLVSENKTKILFRANPSVDGEMHLFVADADGSNVHRVTKDYPSGGGTLRSFIITADGAKVIYIADQDTAGVEELYVVNTSGGAPVKVSGAITDPEGDVTAFSYNEATGKIFYSGDFVTDTILDIYVVKTDGSAHLKLTPAYPHAVNILGWEVARDGSFVGLRWDYNIDEKYEVAKISAAGGAPVTLNASISNSFDLAGFRLSPNSAWICYWGPLSVSGRADARIANTSTPATNYLVAVGTNTVQMVQDCDFTEDSSYVIVKGDWLSDTRSSYKSFAIATQTLYSLNPGLAATAHTAWWSSLQEGANKRLITLSESSPEVYEIFSMNFDGTDLRKINASPYSGGQVNANNGQAVRILDDSDRTIVYSGLIDTVGTWDLYAVKWDGTQKRKLASLIPKADIYDFQVFPGSTRVYYRADNTKDGIMSLYSVNADGTGTKNHTPGLSGNTGAWVNYGVSNSHLFFTSDAYGSQILDLFVDPL